MPLFATETNKCRRSASRYWKRVALWNSTGLTVMQAPTDLQLYCAFTACKQREEGGWTTYLFKCLYEKIFNNSKCWLSLHCPSSVDFWMEKPKNFLGAPLSNMQLIMGCLFWAHRFPPDFLNSWVLAIWFACNCIAPFCKAFWKKAFVWKMPYRIMVLSSMLQCRGAMPWFHRKIKLLRL